MFNNDLSRREWGGKFMLKFNNDFGGRAKVKFMFKFQLDAN